MQVRCRFNRCKKPPVWRLKYEFYGRHRILYTCLDHKPLIEKGLNSRIQKEDSSFPDSVPQNLRFRVLQPGAWERI